MDAGLRDVVEYQGFENVLDSHKHDCENKYAKKGTANAGLTLGM